MKPKRILIIAGSFYPEQTPRAFRATELAKELCRQGHKPTVMAPRKENVQSCLEEYPIEYKNLGKLKWKIFNFKNRGKVGALYNKLVNRLLPLLIEFPSIELFFILRKKLKIEKDKYDILISIAVPYPIHWGVASIWKGNKEKNLAKKWIADCGDPYFFQENDTLNKPIYFKWIEKWFMKKADYITVPTNTSYNGYLPEFHSKLKVIPQGFRFEEITKQEVINDGLIRFGYGGSFTKNRRDPKELLEYLIQLDENFKFEFHIYTKNKDFVNPYSKRDSRIILHSPVTRIQLLEIFSTFNFVVNMANFGTAQTPSKLIDYSIIQKPILQIETGNLDKKTVLDFLEGDYVNSINIMDLDQYRIENVVQQFLKLGSNA